MFEQNAAEMTRPVSEAAPQRALTLKEVQEILQIGTNSAYSLLHSHAFPVISGLGAPTVFRRSRSMTG